MIALKNVSKRYGTLDAVRDVSLSIDEGSIYGIIGRSGAGKSTLLRLVSLLEECDSGEIYYGKKRADLLRGKDLLQARRAMGMIFQNFNLFASRDVSGNIAYPLEIAGFNKALIRRRVDELLEMVGIADKRRARLSGLSGGQKQRVAIARALAAEPDVLFCDEATSALDPQTTREVLGLIGDLQRKLKITVVMVTHQMDVIRSVCSHVAVMDKGGIAEEGGVESVFAAPRSKAAKDLLYAG